MKKFLALGLALTIMAMSLAGCGSSSKSETPSNSTSESTNDTSTTKKDPKDMKIAVILSGSANDGGWSQMAADAAKAVESTYGATVNFTEQVATTDFENTIRGYADAGYDIIVTHGAEFLDAAKLVSAEYPDQTFINTSAESGLEPNLTAVDFSSYELGFLSGAACAMASDAKKIGVIGASEYDTFFAWLQGVKDGSKYIDPEMEVSTAYTGSWDDALKAKQCVDALSAQGCDVIVSNADAGNVGSVQQCAELGIVSIGTVGDQAPFGDNCPVSILQDAQLGIEKAIAMAVEGNIKAGELKMGAADGVVTISDYTGIYADKFSDDERAELQNIWQTWCDGGDLASLVK